MEIKRNNTIEVKLTIDDLKEAISLFLTKNGHEHNKIKNIQQSTKEEYEPMGNIEGEWHSVFDGIVAKVEV